MTDFKAIAASLEERGFCVIPEFMSRDEIDFLVENSMQAQTIPPQRKTSMRRGTLAISRLPVKPALCVLRQWDEKKPSIGYVRGWKRSPRASPEPRPRSIKFSISRRR